MEKPTKPSYGLTLVELMITLVVIAIALTVAVPGFSNFIRGNQVTSQANDFLVSLTFARSEAIKRGQPVAVCASSDQASCSGNNDWDAGWIVFTDADGSAGDLDGTDELLRVHEALSGTTLVADGGGDHVRFLGDGLAGANDDFTLTPPGCEGNQRRSIDMSATGRADVSVEACP